MMRLFGLFQQAGPFSETYTSALAPGKASSRLVGGTLSNLMYTMGTPWEIDLDDAIFAFEEFGSSPHAIERVLLQLKQAGKLQRVRGVVVGEMVQRFPKSPPGPPEEKTSDRNQHPNFSPMIQCGTPSALMVSGCLLVSKNQDMNQFAMGQVFCWSARVMCLGTSPLPIPRVPDRVRQFAQGYLLLPQRLE